MKLRRVRIVICAALLAVGSIALPQAANAATIRCNPVDFRYDVHEGSVPIVIGTITVVENACTTHGHRDLTSSKGKLQWAASGLGFTTGWKWLGSSTELVTRGVTAASYRSTAGVQLCVPFQVSPLCAEDEDFSVRFVAYGPTFVGPRLRPHFSCVSAGCHLHFVYTGRV